LVQALSKQNISSSVFNIVGAIKEREQKLAIINKILDKFWQFFDHISGP